MGKLVGYVRVSTTEQNTDRQLDGVKVDRMFEDKASAKDTNRPQLKAALEYLRDGDTLIVHSMDRLSRNTEDLLKLVRTLNAEQVTVQFVKEKLTFSGGSTPMDQLMLTMLGAFAQFERALIRERQAEGSALAKTKGVYKGRKAALSPEQVEAVRARVAQRESKAALAKEYGVSRMTIYAALGDMEGAESTV